MKLLLLFLVALMLILNPWQFLFSLVCLFLLGLLIVAFTSKDK